MRIKILDNKKILFLGLGLTTFESVLALNEYKDNIIITTKSLEGEYYKNLSEHGYKILQEEEFYKSNEQIDVLFKSPGIPFNHKILKKYKEIEPINDIELAYLYIKENKLDTKIIAITGTNGKTSTTLFLEKFLRNNNLSVQSAGNIGISPLSVLDKMKTLDYLILELSSFQLYNVNKFKPDYAFILNITPDHLNIHKNWEEYVECKKRIFKNQTKKDYLFVKSKVYENFLRGQKIKPQVVLNKVDKKVEDKIIFYQFYGINFNNLLLCYNLGRVLNIDEKYFFKSLNEFEGVEHRVEFVDTINGISYYNDSKATNLEAMKESVKRLNNIILIVGGSSGKGALNEFDSYLKNVNKVITFGENKDEFKSPKIYQRVNGLEDAVRIARSIAKKEECVLLSPASKSFDQYKNYKVRGLHFKRLIKETR